MLRCRLCAVDSPRLTSASPQVLSASACHCEPIEGATWFKLKPCDPGSGAAGQFIPCRLPQTGMWCGCRTWAAGKGSLSLGPRLSSPLRAVAPACSLSLYARAGAPLLPQADGHIALPAGARLRRSRRPHLTASGRSMCAKSGSLACFGGGEARNLPRVGWRGWPNESSGMAVSAEDTSTS